ncbi:hypothetical protein D3C81_1597260 [compost metagenome]
MQGKEVFDPTNQPLLNGTEVIRSLRQQQNLSSLLKCCFDLSHNLVCPLRIATHLQEDILNTSAFWHGDRTGQPPRDHRQLSRGTLRP